MKLEFGKWTFCPNGNLKYSRSTPRAAKALPIGCSVLLIGYDKHCLLCLEPKIFCARRIFFCFKSRVGSKNRIEALQRQLATPSESGIKRAKISQINAKWVGRGTYNITYLILSIQSHFKFISQHNSVFSRISFFSIFAENCQEKTCLTWL